MSRNYSWVILLLSFHVIAVAGTQRKLRDPLDRPNFVLFFVDDLGYGDLGFTGHPTTKTPFIDRLAWNGKVLSTWYSGCDVCSCSRAALMTGRQYPRTGVAPVFGPTGRTGLPVEEITVAEQLKKANYTTAIVGKWHLGQRLQYLPGNQGFDYYLGIPYSDDMGSGRRSSCSATDDGGDTTTNMPTKPLDPKKDDERKRQLGYDEYFRKLYRLDGQDAAGSFLPLVLQKFNRTKIVEQPLDLTTLASKYNDFALKFIENNKEDPFFLYFPFSHVHCTNGNDVDKGRMPDFHYASCNSQNQTKRGPFGDALAEVDWMVGNIHKKLQELNLEENTLILFTSDNGPWNAYGLDGGSYSIFNGQFAGYPWTGKGSTWEGGIREPAFAYWKGQIDSFSRSSETISSLDVFPTLSHLAGVPLPSNVVLDGQDMSDILLQEQGQTKHDFLFFYGNCIAPYNDKPEVIMAVRHGPYKAHFCTAPGLGGDRKTQTKIYDKEPLLFNVEKDPSEAWPIYTNRDSDAKAAIARIMRAYAMEKATFEYGQIPPVPDGPGEGPDAYGLCCDRSRNCNCEEKEWTMAEAGGIFSVGSKAHHDRYHEIVGEENHMDHNIM